MTEVLVTTGAIRHAMLQSNPETSKRRKEIEVDANCVAARAVETLSKNVCGVFLPTPSSVRSMFRRLCFNSSTMRFLTSVSTPSLSTICQLQLR